jgi:hypothetical protein
VRKHFFESSYVKHTIWNGDDMDLGVQEEDD